MAKVKRMKVLKPRDCEKILNFNGFYVVRQSGSHVIFTDNEGKHITIKRGEVNPCIWRRLCKENDLVEPAKIYK